MCVCSPPSLSCRPPTSLSDCALTVFSPGQSPQSCGSDAESGASLECDLETLKCKVHHEPTGYRARARRAAALGKAALFKRRACPLSHTACAIGGAKGFECIDTSTNIEQCRLSLFKIHETLMLNPPATNQAALALSRVASTAPRSPVSRPSAALQVSVRPSVLSLRFAPPPCSPQYPDRNTSLRRDLVLRKRPQVQLGDGDLRPGPHLDPLSPSPSFSRLLGLLCSTG